MKVLSIIEALAYGGAETALVDLVTALDEHTHVVWHFSSVNGIPVNQAHVLRLEEAGIAVRDTHWRTVHERRRRRQALQLFQPDVVIFHWWMHEPWRPWLDERTVRGGPAFVCVLHSSRSTLGPGYDRYVLLSPHQAEPLAHINRGNSRLIPNAVDLERYAGPSRAESSDSATPLRVGTLARLRPLKIPPDLITEIASWAVPQAVWSIAGDGELRDAYAADVARLGEKERIRLVGHLESNAVPAYLAGLDVLCHPVAPGISDTNPIAVVEALAAGVPVVAERRGGLPQLVEHGYSGLLADDRAEMGALLARLSRDRALVRRLAAGARESSARFGRDRQLADYRALLGELVAPEIQASA